jgi:hypothetical protein
MKNNDLKSPSFIISTIIAILAIIFSIYLAYDVEKKMEPVFHYNDSAIIIYNNMTPDSSIKLLKDSIIITENVYLTEIILWNKGEESIPMEMVRDSIKIEFLNTKRILDFKIINETHPTSKFNIYKITENKIGINWKYFDPKNAMKFQIIFTGNRTLNLKFSGYVVGVDKIEKLKIYSSKPQINFLDVKFIFSILVCMLLSIVGFRVLYQKILFRNLSNEVSKSMRKISIVFGIVMGFLLGTIFYSLIQFSSNATLPL